MSVSKFHSYKNIFFTSTDNIDSTELVQYMVPKFCRDNLVFAPNTQFCMIVGTHGLPDGSLGKTDGTLTQSLYQSFFKKIRNVCGIKDCRECLKGNITKHGPSVWNEMGYKRKPILIFNDEVGYKKFQLSEESEEDLRDIAKELCERQKPFVLIFASCFSQKK